MSNLQEIFTRQPVNRTAARVISTGVHYTPSTKGCRNDSENPIHTRPASMRDRAQKEFTDLTGRRIGRLTVIGIAKTTAKLQWVVRCDCGTYSIRNAKAIKNKQNTQDRCDHCRHLAYLKRAEVKRRTGRDVDINEF